MAQLIVARALLIGAGAVAAYLIRTGLEKKSKCFLCGDILSSDTISTTNLRCGHKFHESCLRTYVHSLRHCTMKCPVEHCTQKNVMGVAERRNFELWAPNASSFCHICLKIVKRNVVQSLPCSHCFCKKCLFPYITSMKLMKTAGLKCPMEECATTIPELVTEMIHMANPMIVEHCN